METVVLNCRNPDCEPDTTLRECGVRTDTLSMWECPKCKFVYFYYHVDETLSDGVKPKSTR